MSRWVLEPAAHRGLVLAVLPRLTLTATGTAVLLEWGAHPDAQGYQVFRCESSARPCAPQPVATTQDLFFVDDPGDAIQVWYNVSAIGHPCPANEFCAGAGYIDHGSGQCLIDRINYPSRFENRDRIWHAGSSTDRDSCRCRSFRCWCGSSGVVLLPCHLEARISTNGL